MWRTFPSCPASVLSGIQPGWLHTLAVLSYAPVNRKWPSVAAPGRKEGKTFEITEPDSTGPVCKMWCKMSPLRWKRTVDTRFWWEGTVYRHFLFLSSQTLQVLSPLPVAKWYLYTQQHTRLSVNTSDKYCNCNNQDKKKYKNWNRWKRLFDLIFFCCSVIGCWPIGREVQGVDLLQVSFQEDDAAARPKVPHPAKRIQPSDWTRGQGTERQKRKQFGYFCNH